jgi:hypothetical protein
MSQGKKTEHIFDPVTGKEMKWCSVSKHWLELEQFCKLAVSWDGLHWGCKQCEKVRNKEKRNKKFQTYHDPQTAIIPMVSSAKRRAKNK